MPAEHLTAERVREFVHSLRLSQPGPPELPPWVDKSVVDAAATLLDNDLTLALAKELRLDERQEAERTYALAAELWEDGRHRESVNTLRHAVDLFRQLADRVLVHEPAVATSLHDLSIDLATLGELDDSIAAARESVKLLTELSKRAASQFEPLLGKALINLSLRLSDAGFVSDSLRASQESVAVLQRVAGADAAYEPALADALNNHAFALLDSAPSAAVEVLTQAVGIMSRWAAVDASYQDGLDVLVGNLVLMRAASRNDEDEREQPQAAASYARDIAFQKIAARVAGNRLCPKCGQIHLPGETRMTLTLARGDSARSCTD
jgi:tetratricopeptide (TPR) repeat protein